jgi:MoxR-like ATPase
MIMRLTSFRRLPMIAKDTRSRPTTRLTMVANTAKPILADVKDDPRASLDLLERELRRIVDDKHQLIDVTICALLSNGHVLLEDVPGVGKTTFIKALSILLGLEMARVQFTSDLMPSDIVGVGGYDADRKALVFHPGPIFTQVLLADE